MTKKEQNIWDKIDNLDTRILYVVIFIGVSSLVIRPIGLPISISKSVQSAYNFINALPEGSNILCGFETGAGGYNSQGPQMAAYANHLFDRNMKLIFVSGFIDGPTCVDTLLFKSLNLKNKVYGVDYVLLGYISGGATGMAAFASDINNIFKTDYYGTPLENIPMMKDLKMVNQYKLILCCSSGSPGWQDYLKQYISVYGGSLIVGALGSAPEMVPYYQSGQIVGYTPDLRGAAEYEILSGHPGYAVTSLDALSVYHLIILAFIAIGNIAYFINRYGKKGG